jgi:SAM-dependent methyltransferase
MDHRMDIRHALEEDAFNDEAQYGQTTQEQLYPVPASLLEAFLPADTLLLEVGPGTTPYNRGSIFLEPSLARYAWLVEFVGGSSTVNLGYIEDMPFEDESFGAALMLNGFFQVQALYEAILEVNRVLRIGGRFLFNIHTGDDGDIIVGQVFGPKNLVRTFRQFGFEPLCVWEGKVNVHRTGGDERQAFIVVEKRRRASAADLNQPQLIPFQASPLEKVVDPARTQLYVGLNVDLAGREAYLA